MTDDATIYPNAMSFLETKHLFEAGDLEMVVDQGLALTAINSGVSLTRAGRVGLITMLLGPLLALVLALTESWLSLAGVPITAIGGFRFVRGQAVTSVRNIALVHEKLFAKFRESGLISFQFRD